MEFEVPTHGTFALYSRLYSTLHTYVWIPAEVKVILYPVITSDLTQFPLPICPLYPQLPSMDYPNADLPRGRPLPGGIHCYISSGDSVCCLISLHISPCEFTLKQLPLVLPSRSLSLPLPSALPLALLVSASWVCADFALSIVCSLSLFGGWQRRNWCRCVSSVVVARHTHTHAHTRTRARAHLWVEPDFFIFIFPGHIFMRNLRAAAPGPTITVAFTVRACCSYFYSNSLPERDGNRLA